MKTFKISIQPGQQQKAGKQCLINYKYTTLWFLHRVINKKVSFNEERIQKIWRNITFYIFCTGSSDDRKLTKCKNAIIVIYVFFSFYFYENLQIMFCDSAILEFLLTISSLELFFSILKFIRAIKTPNLRLFSRIINYISNEKLTKNNIYNPKLQFMSDDSYVYVISGKINHCYSTWNTWSIKQPVKTSIKNSLCQYYQ